MPISAPSDFRSVHLGDARLNDRLLTISEALQERPSESFPKSFADDAGTEAFYRFLANDRVEWRVLFDAHADATRQRVQNQRRVLAVHDTTLCQFSGTQKRSGCFRTSSKRSGFMAHTCLAVSADGRRQPFGLLDMVPVVRLKGEEAEASPGVTYDVESERWLDLVVTTEDEKPKGVELVHIMDSEGDAFPLLAHMVQLDAFFVVRLCQNRLVLTWAGVERLDDIVPDATLRLERTVKLSRRQASSTSRKRPRNAARDERKTVLEVRTTSANLLRPAGSDAYLAGIHLNIVHVVERDPPEDEEPVSWVLATTLPLNTTEEVEAVVDAYRARWLIEEWFKALKTGCAYEKRQLESLDALLTVFALMAPTATRLLDLRWVGRNEPDRPASEVMTPAELRLLRLLEKKKRRVFPKKATAGDVLLAIARLGGFLKSNKVAGWQVLGRGFEDFSKMLQVYELMTSEDGEM